MERGVDGVRAEFTSKSAFVRADGAYRFSFFCDICDGSYTTGDIWAQDLSTAQMLAREEARSYFNLCHRCRRWICDEHYNEDVMMCTECAPRE